MTLPITNEALLEELVRLADKARDKQRYLELRSRDSNPTIEAAQTAAEAVKELADQLDKLVAKHVVDHAQLIPPTYMFHSRLWNAIKYEYQRRRSLEMWVL